METILIVDDEQVICDVLSMEIRDLGYSVLTAPDCERAFAIVKNRPDIRLVFLDINMPMIDGYKCAESLRRHRPIGIILISGAHQSDKSVQRAFGDGATGFLSKPFSAKQLKATIDAILGDNGADLP